MPDTTKPTPPQAWIKYIATKGGQAKSAKKAESSRKNWQKALAAIEAKKKAKDTHDTGTSESSR